MEVAERKKNMHLVSCIFTVNLKDYLSEVVHEMVLFSMTTLSLEKH
jgi:hypothetical protein